MKDKLQATKFFYYIRKESSQVIIVAWAWERVHGSPTSFHQVRIRVAKYLDIFKIFNFLNLITRNIVSECTTVFCDSLSINTQWFGINYDLAHFEPLPRSLPKGVNDLI